MKTLLFGILLLTLNIVHAQTFYWSTTPFEFCKEPEKNTTSKVFSDTENLYGLCVIKNVDISKLTFSYTYKEADVRADALDLLLTVKGTKYIKAKYRATVWEKNNTLFLYFAPIPNVIDKGYVGVDNVWRDIWNHLKNGANEIILESDPTKKKFISIKESIILNSSGKYDYEKIKEINNKVEELTVFSNSLNQLDKNASDKTKDVNYDQYLNNRVEYNFPNSELSKENIEKLLALHHNNEVFGKGNFKIKKTFTSSIQQEWLIWKNQYSGVIENKRSPLLLLVFEAPNGWCYYGAYYVVKSYEGSDKYGKAFLLGDEVNHPHGGYVERIGCDQIK